jgi:hypothetical protein
MDLPIKDRVIMRWTTCLSYLYTFFYDYQILSCDIWPTFNTTKTNIVTKKNHVHKYNMGVQAPNSHTKNFEKKTMAFNDALCFCMC